MTQSEFDLIIKEGENGLNDLIKYFEIKSYKLPQLKIANNSLNNILQINNLLYFYEIVFNQAFQYLTSNIKQKIIEDDFNQDNFKEFVKIPKMKRDILMFIVDNLGDFDIQLLKDVFVQMDVNKDGTLTLQEFKDGIIKLFPTENDPVVTTESNNFENDNQEKKIRLDDETLRQNKVIVDKAEELFQSFDLDSEGRFDYNDFIINSLDRHLILMEDKLFMAFWMMDRDGSGKLDKREIKQALSLDIDNASLDKMISQYDLNGDGEIDYLEFLNLMLNPPPKEEEVETGKKKKLRNGWVYSTKAHLRIY